MRAAKNLRGMGSGDAGSTFGFRLDGCGERAGAFATAILPREGAAQTVSALQPADYQRMRSVAQAEFSPDAKLVAYTVVRYDRPGRPWPQLWVMDVASGKSTRIGGENDSRLKVRCGRPTGAGSRMTARPKENRD